MIRVIPSDFHFLFSQKFDDTFDTIFKDRVSNKIIINFFDGRSILFLYMTTYRRYGF